MIRFSMIGAASNAGGEMLRMMINHPETELAYVADGFSSGLHITEVHPA